MKKTIKSGPKITDNSSDENPFVTNKNLSSINHARLDKLHQLTNSYCKATLLDKLIYWWQISKYKLDDGNIYFTRPIPQISLDSKIPVRSIQRYLKEFKEAGYISTQNKLFKKKHLYVRVTVKLLIAIGAVAMINEPIKKKPLSTNLAQDGGTENAKTALSSNKDNDNNLSVSNSTVSHLSSVDNLKKTNTTSVNSLYPTYSIDGLIGEKLQEVQKNYIKGMMNQLNKNNGIQPSERLYAEIVFSVLNKEHMKGVEDFTYRVQIISKLLREKRWRTPKGFYNHSDFGQQFKIEPDKKDLKPKKPNKFQDKKNSKFEIKQAINKIQSEIASLSNDLTTESRYLDDITQAFVCKSQGTQSQIDTVISKIEEITKKRAQAIQELQVLENQLNPTYAPVQAVVKPEDNIEEYQDFLQQQAQSLQLIAENHFDQFCALSKTLPKQAPELEVLYTEYEKAHEQWMLIEKQLNAIERGPNHQRAA